MLVVFKISKTEKQMI